MKIDRWKIIIASIMAAVLLIIGFLLSTVLVSIASGMDVEVSSITIGIEGHDCNISAGLNFSPDLDARPGNLDVVFNGSTAPLQYNGEVFSTHLDEQQFREVVERRIVNIKGDVNYNILPGIRTTRSIDTNADLSFLGEIFSSVEVKNASLSTVFPMTSVVEFDLSVEMEREVEITANNTEATISNGIQDHNVKLVHLELHGNGSGRGRVEMPTSTLLSLALWGKNVTIDAWGLKAEFIFPFSR